MAFRAVAAWREHTRHYARLVYDDLAADPESTRHVDAITDSLGNQLTESEVERALREFEAAQRAVVTFGGWSVLL